MKQAAPDMFAVELAPVAPVQAAIVAPPMLATVITMIDGKITQEPAAEHFARIEREKAEAAEREASTTRHCQAMRRLNLVERRAYLTTVEQAEGSGAYYRLKAAVTAEWQRRRGPV